MRQHNSSSRHLYVVHVSERDCVIRDLKVQGIETALHYPKPIHLQRCFRDLGFVKGSLPVTEPLADELLSLPLFPGMTSEQVDRVVDALNYSVP
jgi:dTDP-4-amino-4,6-dideoxygalactose transaminase